MRARKPVIAGGAALAAVALSLALVPTAQADIGPQPGDVVGVGSDTVQNIMNFIADGDPSGSSAGVNAAGGRNRVFSFDATPDANDRAGYLNGSTSGALKPLNPTIVLRAGSSPVQRPNGSGSGIAALLADKTKPYKINFVRSSRLPSVTEQNTAINNSGFVGGLHVVKISTDALKIAATDATRAPASLTAAQLVDIYKCNITNWNQLGGTAGTIVPLIPQAGSGTRSTFLADLTAANGGTAVTLGSCVQTVEENDPSAITGSSSPNDTIAPFSEGRDNLYNSGYFYDPNTVFPGASTPINPGIKMLGGYVNNRGLYVVFRDADKSSTTKWQAGSNQNFVQALFLNPGGGAPYVASGDGQAAITAGGATPAYADCGAGPSVTSC